MTFDAIKKAVKDYCNLTSQDADTRVGESINQHYRRLTALIGMDSTRFVTRTATTTAGVQTVEFTEIEHIDRIRDTTSSASVRLLREVSMHDQRIATPTTSQPNTYAVQASGASSVTVLLDTLPQTDYTLQADGTTTLADLQGDDSPAFPESFHNILTWFVLSEELLKKEKVAIAKEYERKARELQADMVFQLQDSHTRLTRQGDSTRNTSGSGSSTGSSSLGGTSYTQTADLHFDRGAGAAPFFVDEATAATVTNLDADKLDGEDGSFYLNRDNHTGALNVTAADIALTAGDTLLGRDTAGAGAGEEITLTNGLAFTGSQSIGIQDDGVTYARIQNISASSRLLGRGSASSGDPQEISLGTNLTMSGTTLNASAVAGNTTEVQYNDAGTQAGATGLTYSAGIINSSTQPRCAAYHNTTLSVADNTWTALTFNSEEFDVGTMHDTGSNTSRLTVPSGGDGLYLIIGGVSFAANATGFRGVRFRKNGSAVVGNATVVTPLSSDATAIECHALVVLAAGDYIEVQAFQNSGSALNTGDGSNRHGQNSGYAVKLW